MSAKQYHTIRHVKKRNVEQTSYGRMQEYALAVDTWGEPVKLQLSEEKPAPEIGDKVYGWLSEHTSPAGTTYMQLNVATKPQPTTDQRIKAQWAIGQAVSVFNAAATAGGISPLDDQLKEAYGNIKREAKHFYRMVEEVIEENENAQ